MTSFLTDTLVLQAFFGGLGVALVAGPLGTFVVWRRMAYFGAALAHAALLGVALGILVDILPLFGVAIVSLAMAGLLAFLDRMASLSTDTLLGILAHGALAAGLVAAGFIDAAAFNLSAYLFGDILSVSQNDLIFIYVGGAVVLFSLFMIWRPLLALTVHEELARVEGVRVEQTRLVFLLLLALVVALSMKVVGLLLITSLLIIPPAAARHFSKTPEDMGFIAALIGALSVALGLAASFTMDTPAGPSIVVAALFFFVGGEVASKARGIA